MRCQSQARPVLHWTQGTEGTQREHGRQSWGQRALVPAFLWPAFLLLLLSSASSSEKAVHLVLWSG